MSETHALQLPLLAAEQAQKHVTVNEGLTALDALVQLGVKDRSVAVPPASPAEGDRYIVGVAPTGGWTGHQGEIAAFANGSWSFHAPREGWRAWVDDENALLVYDGAAWVDFSALITVLQNLALLGIGTTADATNPFAAKLNKALWTAKTAAEGGDGDLRYTMNKETAGDVLSILMQRGFSGRAELGLIGDDDFTLKVSADGSAWLDALRVDRSTGNVGMGIAPTEALHVQRTGSTAARVQVEGEQAVNNQVRRVSSNATSATFTLQKARGTLASQSSVAQNDNIGILRAQAHDGAAYRTVSDLQSTVIAAAPSATDMEGRVVLLLVPAASGTATEILRLDHATGLSMFGANAVVDQNRHFRLRSYTIATLPAASAAAGQMIWCSDLGGGGAQLNSDGTSWRRVSRGGQQAVATDAAFTLTTLTSAEEQRHTGTLTANRVVTLSTTNAYSGARFRMTRTGGRGVQS